MVSIETVGAFLRTGTVPAPPGVFLPVQSSKQSSGTRAAVLAAVESVAVSAVALSCGCVVGFGWMVVRFVRVIRVPACARVSRVSRVCRCVPAPPVSFYRYYCNSLL